MKERILIIEANKEIRENTAELLELKNYRLLTAEDGCSGFKIAKQYHPDLIICDLTIADTDAYTFLQLVKQDTAIFNIPLIFFLDGDPCPDENHKWMKIAKGYLCKPFTAQDLFAGVVLGLSARNATRSYEYNA